MMTSPRITPRRRRRQAFSIIELLSVMAIIVTLSAVTIPVFNSIKGGGNVNKAVADLSSTLELARTYAMANRTHVRVLFGHVPGENGRLAATIALPVCSADGSPGPATDMADGAKWPALSKPLVLDDLKIFDSLQANLPHDTSADVTPMGANVQGGFMSPVSRPVPGRGEVSFTGVVQFGPGGEARVGFDEPSRHIKIAMDEPLPAGGAESRKKNPFILRLSGVNGAISVLRAEDVAL